MKFKIKVTCDNGHIQEILYQNVDRKFVEMQAGLLDGTSDLYVYKPGRDSSIGKCSLCWAQIHCEVFDAN